MTKTSTSSKPARPSRRSSVVAALAAAAVSTAGCLLHSQFYEYRRSPSYPTDPAILFQDLKDIVRKKNFSIASEDSAAMTFQTAWSVDLGVFSDTGQRTRVSAKVEPDGAGGHLVAVLAEREINTAASDTLDPERADWSADGHDEGLEEVILTNLQIRRLRESGGR